MKIWKLTIEDAKGKAKGQFFTTVKSSNGETTHSSETIKMKANANKSLLAFVKAIQEGRFKIVDNTKPVVVFKKGVLKTFKGSSESNFLKGCEGVSKKPLPVKKTKSVRGISRIGL